MKIGVNSSRGYIALPKLKELIDELMDQQTTDKMSLDKFFSKFEEYYGWKLDYRDYEFKDKDELISEIIQRGFINVDNTVYSWTVTCPPKKKKTLLEVPQNRAEVTTTNLNV